MNNRDLRVAMISEHGDPLAPIGGQQSGGQNIYVYELARSLSKIGVKVDVFTRHENPADPTVELFAPKARVIRLKAGPMRFVSKEKFDAIMPFFLEEFFGFIKRKKIKYDLIHSHYYYSGWAGVKIKETLDIPLVATFHSLGVVKRKAMGLEDKSPDKRLLIEKEVMDRADHIVAVSPDEKRNIVKEYKINSRKVTVVPPGVNFEKFTPLAKDRARRIAEIDSKSKVIVFAGKLDRGKGVFTLIEAVNFLKKHWPLLYKDLIVYIFSGDPRGNANYSRQDRNLKREFFSLINEYGLADKIRLKPAIEQVKLHTFYAAADVIVMPSLYETFGLVAVEAMATVRPVIASKVGGLKWSIINGTTGLHAKPQNPKDFALQIVKVLQDEEWAQTLGINAYLRVRSNFNWFWTSREILEIYKSLIIGYKDSFVTLNIITQKTRNTIYRFPNQISETLKRTKIGVATSLRKKI